MIFESCLVDRASGPRMAAAGDAVELDGRVGGARVADERDVTGDGVVGRSCAATIALCPGRGGLRDRRAGLLRAPRRAGPASCPNRRARAASAPPDRYRRCTGRTGRPCRGRPRRERAAENAHPLISWIPATGATAAIREEKAQAMRRGHERAVGVAGHEDARLVDAKGLLGACPAARRGTRRPCPSGRCSTAAPVRWSAGSA